MPDQSKLEIIITLADGTQYVEAISGPAASAGLDTFMQWMEEQNQTAGNSSDQRPRFPNPAYALKYGIVQTILQLAERFPSKALQADLDALAAAQAAVDAKRNALVAAAIGAPTDPAEQDS